MTRDPFDDYEREAGLARDFEREHPRRIARGCFRRDRIEPVLPPARTRTEVLELLKDLAFPAGSDPLDILRKAGLL